jgi:hypothetical protein
MYDEVTFRYPHSATVKKVLLLSTRAEINGKELHLDQTTKEWRTTLPLPPPK